VSVASFIASQRAGHGVPHAVACRALGVSESWFYKWHDRPPTPRQERRAELDKAVAEVFEGSGGRYGSPRVHDEPPHVWRTSARSAPSLPDRPAASLVRRPAGAGPRRSRQRYVCTQVSARPVRLALSGRLRSAWRVPRSKGTAVSRARGSRLSNALGPAAYLQRSSAGLAPPSFWSRSVTAVRSTYEVPANWL
jgi:hypothetical protein